MPWVEKNRKIKYREGGWGGGGGEDDYSGLESRHIYMYVIIDYCRHLIIIISIKTKKKQF